MRSERIIPLNGRLSLVAVVVVALVVGGIYFFSSSDGSGPQPVPEPTQKPAVEKPGRIIVQSDRITISEAEFRSFENNTLSLVRGDEVLTAEYNPYRGMWVRKKVGPRFVTITPEELLPGSTLRVYSFFIDRKEIIGSALAQNND